MKNLFTLFVILFSVLPLFAQDGYKPFLKDGRTWIVEYRGFSSQGQDVVWKFYYSVAGDTIVDGRPVKIITDEYEGKIIERFGAYEEDMQVFEVNLKSGRTELAISFREKEWNELFNEMYKLESKYNKFFNENEWWSFWKVSRDEMMAKGTKYRRLKVCADSQACVEGIGLSTDFRICRGFGQSVNGITCLAAVYDGDELIFSEGDFYAPSSNGADAITNVSDNSSASSSAMYDLMGRRITQPRRGSIILQNGGKRVVR